MSDISRRGILSGLAAAPVAVPVAAQAMIGAVSERAYPRGLAHAGGGVKRALNERVDSAAFQAAEAAFDEFQERRSIRADAMDSLDPSIECLRSVSRSQKVRMQRQLLSQERSALDRILKAMDALRPKDRNLDDDIPF